MNGDYSRQLDQVKGGELCISYQLWIKYNFGEVKEYSKFTIEELMTNE